MEEYIVRKISKKRNQKYYHKYYDINDQLITDNQYIQKHTEGFYIPPAYDNVKINLHKKNKVRAIGYDTKNRPQYIYNKEFITQQQDKKFNHMVHFGKKFNTINRKINEDLYSVKDSKEKQIAIILKLIMDCHFRVGNERYNKENKSYGTTTLEIKHMKVKKNEVIIDFIGKKKVRNICTVKNKRVVKSLREKKRTHKKNDRIFSYRKGEKYFTIQSRDVNHYLKQFGKFTTKNFRTWGANIELITQLLHHSKKNNSKTKKENQAILKQSIEKVASKLHNTPAVCKSNYLDPELIRFFTNDSNGFSKKFLQDNKINRETICKEYITFLESI
tara:strand:+ start:9410 stop:10402 length:993 start_codon:yes stop_codon:yes gene_type:complete